MPGNSAQSGRRNEARETIGLPAIGFACHMTVCLRDLAQMIDHSLLRSTMTDEDIPKGCELAAPVRVAAFVRQRKL